jgi:fumarate hydratase subunit beta
MIYHLNLPFRSSDIQRLRFGDEVLLTGSMLAARDQAHKRMVEALKRGEPLPVDLSRETIYYMGPAPAPEGRVIGSCGPTTSARMDAYTPLLLQHRLIGMIGKGPRSSEVIEAIRAHRAIYFAAYGGCGALYAECVTHLEVLGYEELGPEALYRITVQDFPVITAVDAHGGNIYA